jgi:APA family basic amino acid/polyamine antiporter
MISIFTIATIYIFVALVVYGSMSPTFYASYDFANGSVAEVAATFLPFIIAVFVAFAGSIAIISDINPTILSTSRLSFAWARDKIVPEKLAELNKNQVPKWTLLINGVMAIAIILLARQFIEAVMMINMAVLLVFIATSVSALILPYKHPDIYKNAEFRLKGLWIFALIGFLSSALFFVFVVRLEDAMPGFILLLIWLSIGSIIYVYTQEKHKMYWRIQRQQRKEKERADKKLIREIIGSDKQKN